MDVNTDYAKLVQAKKILIVEDDLIQMLFLKRAMKFLGHEVIGSAVRGARAIELVDEFQPDITLMDISLGGKLNGVETAAQILKKIDCFIIYITGNTNETLIHQANQTQPSTILPKPITTQDIKNVIDTNPGTLD